MVIEQMMVRAPSESVGMALIMNLGDASHDAIHFVVNSYRRTNRSVHGNSWSRFSSFEFVLDIYLTPCRPFVPIPL